MAWSVDLSRIIAGPMLPSLACKITEAIAPVRRIGGGRNREGWGFAEYREHGRGAGAIEKGRLRSVWMAWERRYNWIMVTRRQIERLARFIGEEFGAVRVVLFGSYAYGRPREDSDVDLLVVMETEGDVVEKGGEIYAAVDRAGIAPFSMDLLVRRPEEIAERVRLGDFFMREIMERGKVVYEAADAGVGRKGGKGLPQRAA